MIIYNTKETRERYNLTPIEKMSSPLKEANQTVLDKESGDELLEWGAKLFYFNYYNWLITLKDTKQIIGAINFNVNLRNDSVMFNYAIDNRFTGNGYMTEALEVVKNFAFGKMGVHRFEGAVWLQILLQKE